MQSAREFCRQARMHEPGAGHPGEAAEAVRDDFHTVMGLPARLGTRMAGVAVAFVLDGEVARGEGGGDLRGDTVGATLVGVPRAGATRVGGVFLRHAGVSSAGALLRPAASAHMAG